MNRRRTLYERISPGCPDLTQLGENWSTGAVSILLKGFWAGCDDLVRHWIGPAGGTSRADLTLERNLNSQLDPWVQKHISKESPFYFQHKPDETETLHSDTAQPPEPDFGFRLWADPKQLWAIEAKVLTTDGNLAEYLKEVKNNFLKCRYSPWVDGGAMLAYLLEGEPAKVFANIKKKLPCKLADHPDFPNRDHRTSDHQRAVLKGKAYPKDFRCHHLVLCVGKAHLGASGQ